MTFQWTSGIQELKWFKNKYRFAHKIDQINVFEKDSSLGTGSKQSSTETKLFGKFTLSQNFQKNLDFSVA